MGSESPIERYDRLRLLLQGLVLKAYPNPERKACIGGKALEELARRARNFDEGIHEHADFHHVTHCSPCYREFLDATEELRKLEKTKRKRLSRRFQKELGETLEQFEQVLRTVAGQAKRE